jgi:hypothetical protein
VLLAEAPELIVMSDAGTGPSLADRLRGSDPAAATTAVLAWAEAIAGVQAASVDLGPAFAAALEARSPLGPPPVDTSVDELAGAADALATHLPRLGVRPREAALDTLRGLAGALEAGPKALDPGDACPDNNVEVNGGPLLLDFEWAEFRHVGWAGVYPRVPWPTCWCSWRMPEEVGAAAVDRWRRTLAPSLPVVATPGFDDALELIAAAWTFLSIGLFLPRALDGDPPSRDPSRSRPSLRALLPHRLAATMAAPAPVPAELTDLAAQILAATRREWGDRPLPLAPAWRC